MYNQAERGPFRGMNPWLTVMATAMVINVMVAGLLRALHDERFAARPGYRTEAPREPWADLDDAGRACSVSFDQGLRFRRTGSRATRRAHTVTWMLRAACRTGRWALPSAG